MAQHSTTRLPELEDFPIAERNSAVKALLQLCHAQQRRIDEQAWQIELQAQQLQLQSEQIALQKEEIARLKDEVAILKGEKGRPKIKPSGLNRDVDGGQSGSQQKRGKPGCKKTRQLKIHHERVIEPTELPPGSKFKGYERFVVQDIEINLSNTRYLRARYETPDGGYVIGELPAAVSGCHFGPTLRSYILNQYYQSHVSQNLILQQLWGLGVRISAGELNQIITEKKEGFHAEKDEVLRVGLEVSAYVNVDDTGARHQGRNGFCTQIGNELFTWFSSTANKSRINFLELLRAGVTTYVIDSGARAYMRGQRLPVAQQRLFAEDREFPDKPAWELHLKALSLNERCCRIATEGALVGCLLAHGKLSELVIMSDDAGRKARDTMLSLKKTCQKLGISFWRYLLDRVSGLNLIPPLPDLIRASAQSP